jgi:hypothetical protein
VLCYNSYLFIAYKLYIPRPPKNNKGTLAKSVLKVLRSTMIILSNPLVGGLLAQASRGWSFGSGYKHCQHDLADH